ncbi:MAG TPA: hypothetical protein VFT33_08825 [Gaiellaceae bacterium]|nr:hypothetical protein [Gaiellaceae bacterium]
MVERTPEEEERYQASLEAAKLFRPDTHDLSLSDFTQVKADLEHAVSVLQLHADVTATDADDDQRQRLQNAIVTLEALIQRIPS